MNSFSRDVRRPRGWNYGHGSRCDLHFMIYLPLCFLSLNLEQTPFNPEVITSFFIFLRKSPTVFFTPQLKVIVY